MTPCYRSTPRDLGAFIDALYQQPTLLLLGTASIIAVAVFLWRKKHVEQ